MPEKDILTMKLELVPEIPAFKLAALLDSLEKFYSYSLWLDLVEKSEKDSTLSTDYVPEESEILWVEGLEIGTPNFLKLRGTKEFIVAVSCYIATITGGPQAVLDLGKTIAEIHQTFAQTEQIRAETEIKEIEKRLKEIDLRERISKLKEQGKISSKESKHKETQMNEVDKKAKNGASIVVDGSIKII